MVVVGSAGGFSTLTRKNGIKLGAGSPCSVEEMCLAVGEVIGHGSIKPAAIISGAVVLFVERVEQAQRLVEAGISVNRLFLQVSPLTLSATRVTLLNVPPFIIDEFPIKEPSRHGANHLKGVKIHSVFSRALSSAPPARGKVGNMLLPHCHGHEEKMISRILLLIIINSCLCAATFVVNVTQSSYQAEENHNITLEWTFTTRPSRTWRKLIIICELLAPPRASVLYHVHDGVEVSESLDEQFSGRVQSDKDVLREGRIRLHVSRLRTEDSGLYACDVMTKDGFNSETCLLNITAAADQIQTQRPTLTPEPEKPGRTFIFIPLGLTAALMVLIMLMIWFLKKRKNRKKNQLRSIKYMNRKPIV